jgi:hypothetical protein
MSYITWFVRNVAKLSRKLKYYASTTWKLNGQGSQCHVDQGENTQWLACAGCKGPAILILKGSKF